MLRTLTHCPGKHNALAVNWEATVGEQASRFVPTRDGISHSRKEFSSWQDVANGAEVLYRGVLLLDDRLNRNGFSERDS
jgi:acetylornithine deacetylase/succinyl-diaminopimelate desuccinylase-like protein